MSQTIKSLILDENELNLDNNPNNNNTTKKQPEITYTTEVESGCDVAIKRNTKRTEKLLVLIPSQGQYYIKDNKTGQIETLTEKNLTTFFKGQNNIEIPGSWACSFENNIENKRSFITAINQDNVKNAISANLLTKHTINHIDRNLERWTTLWNSIIRYCDRMEKNIDKPNAKPIYKFINKQYGKNDEINTGKYNASINNIDLYLFISQIIGIDKTKILIDKIANHPTYEPENQKNIRNSSYNITSSIAKIVEVFTQNTNDNNKPAVLNNILNNEFYHLSTYENDEEIIIENYNKLTNKPINADKFIDYITEQSIEEGYGLNLWDFCSDWCDTLIMQYQLTNEIVEKYPMCLATQHQQLSYETAKAKQILEEKQWKETIEKLDKYNAKVNNYLFIIPQTPKDVYTEAIQQNNCLASYVPRIANGSTIIVFMRHKETPDKSYVTIEINHNNELQQTKKRFNKPIDDKDKLIIDKWLKQINSQSKGE